MAHVQVTCQVFIGLLFWILRAASYQSFHFKHGRVTGQTLFHFGLGGFLHQ